MSRREKESSSSRLRMDNSRTGRSRAVTPPTKPELDKVMKKARSRDGASQSNYWNKKLLEAEEKDPNRWRHSGYKELYGGSPESRQRSRSRSRVTKPRRSRSRERRRPHTPQPATKTRPPAKKTQVVGRALSSSRSLSSCSDESCSVCSPRPKQPAQAAVTKRKRPATPLKQAAQHRSRSRSFSVPRSGKPAPAPPAPVRRKRRANSSPPRDPRPAPPQPPPKVKPHATRKTSAKKRVKPAPRPRAPSPSASSSSGSSSPCSAGVAPPKMTLSERFGKMAQWTVDRRDLEGASNMRITKDAGGSDLKVTLQHRHGLMPASDRRTGAGFYPEALHTGPTGLEAWDDVRVRYKYYKDRGYLRDLTLDDYMKWEEWWYKYQEWLENERCYERWEELRAQHEEEGMYRGKRRGRRRDF